MNKEEFKEYSKKLMEERKYKELYEASLPLVEDNNEIAIFNIGKMYFQGLYLEKDLKKSFEYIKKAYELGSVDAICGMGNFYITGRVVEQDVDKGYKLYKEAMEKGSIPAYMNLGQCYQKGMGVEKNGEKALEYFNLGMKHGLANCYYFAAEVYYYGCGNVQKDFNKAFELYSKAVEYDVSQAYYKLGECYFSGFGTEMNKVKALDYYLKYKELFPRDKNVYYPLGFIYEIVLKDYKKALEYYFEGDRLGNPDVCYIISDMYYCGKGVDSNFDISFKYALKAVQLTKGMYAYQILGLHYYEGYGCLKDYDKAFDCFLEAKKLGSKFVYKYLGCCYMEGLGTQVVYSEAARYLKLAIEYDSEDKMSIQNLGVLYHRGNGVSQDYGKAVELYRRAMDLGSIHSFYNLGICYLDGNGVPKNQELAYEMIAKAAQNNIEDAISLLRKHRRCLKCGGELKGIFKKCSKCGNVHN